MIDRCLVLIDPASVGRYKNGSITPLSLVIRIVRSEE
jgi:hypothetical protein